MTKEELIEFLKKNLWITSEVRRTGTWFPIDRTYIQVKLGEELISEVHILTP